MSPTELNIRNLGWGQDYLDEALDSVPSTWSAKLLSMLSQSEKFHESQEGHKNMGKEPDGWAGNLGDFVQGPHSHSSY